MKIKEVEEMNYETAKKRVDKIKGFYIHLLVFVVINIMIIYANHEHADANEPFFQFKTFSTAFWWGIGLLIHGANVFLFDRLLGREWEEKKIKEIMERDRNDLV